jgi:hypothetical protein
MTEEYYNFTTLYAHALSLSLSHTHTHKIGDIVRKLHNYKYTR